MKWSERYGSFFLLYCLAVLSVSTHGYLSVHSNSNAHGLMESTKAITWNNKRCRLRNGRECFLSINQTRFQSALHVRGGDDDSTSISNNNKHVLVERIRKFSSKNFFLLGMFCAVTLANLFPGLGVNGGPFRPELTISKFGVFFIFLLSGLSLEVSELKYAIGNTKLNFLTQFTSFVAWPFLVGLPIVQILGNIIPTLIGCDALLPQPLLDGLLILTCLPTTVNMCIFLTSASNGSVATALCNAALGNLLGIFATPALLLQFFGTSIELPFADMVFKLANKVLLPVSLGQLLRTTKMKEYYAENSKFFKRTQEIILLGIVWNAFSNAFTRGFGLEFSNVIVLLTVLPILHVGSLYLLFKLSQSKALGFTKGEHVAFAYTASHKTLAFGLPLVNTIFMGNPNLASYCAPIMFIHPLQLVLGSFLVPYFANYMSNDSEAEN